MVKCPHCGVEVACKDEEYHKKKNEFEHFQPACDQKLSEMFIKLQSNTTAMNETRGKIVHFTKQLDNSLNAVVSFKGEVERYFEMHDKKLDDLSNALVNIRDLQQLKCPSKVVGNDSLLGISLTVKNIIVMLCVILFLMISALVCMQVKITTIHSKLVEWNDLITMVMVDTSKHDICMLDWSSQTKFILQKIKNDFKTLHCVKIEEATEDTTKVASLYLESDEPQVAPVTLKMFNFTEKIKNKKQWYSDPFLTFDGGYQMCLRAHSNYDGTFLSVYVYLMKGPHDNKLDQSGYFPMEGDITIEIQNHGDNMSHHVTTVRFHYEICKICTSRVFEGEMVEGWGYSNVISIDAFFRRDMNYLYNDTLSFRVSYGSINYWPSYVRFSVTGLVYSMIFFILYCCYKRGDVDFTVLPVFFPPYIFSFILLSLDLPLAGELVWIVIGIGFMYVMYVGKDTRDIPHVRIIAGLLIVCFIIRILLINVFFVKPKLML